MKPRRIDSATRLSLALLSRLCDWRSCLMVVRPETVVRWHRAGWRRLWRYKSRPGRPPIPLELRQLIRRMATDNPPWGDFRYLIHDRDSIFARRLDESIKNLGLTVLESPPHSPKANAIGERVIGTIRRECMDWLIPLSESHLRSMLKVWVTHYNRARPHMALGPGVPDRPAGAVLRANEKSPHHLGARAVRVRPLGAGRLASRIFARARTGLIDYLRITAILCPYDRFG